MYTFPFKDIISSKQFKREDLENIFEIAKNMEKIVR
jgi:aspartate carbamoyltransferase catalytic subunit